MELEWYKISIKFPNAWSTILMNLRINIIVTEDDLLFLKVRDNNPVPLTLTYGDLVSAFDMEEIYIITECNENGKIWNYRLVQQIFPIAVSKQTYSSRAMANAKAIYAAFEYLENFYKIKGTVN